MPDYKKMYSLIFHASTDAIRELEHENYGNAKEILIHAQLKCEAIYMEEDEK